MSEGPSRPRGGSKTARHTAPRRGLGPLLPSRSRPLPRPPTRHVPASPAPRDLLPSRGPSFGLFPRHRWYSQRENGTTPYTCERFPVSGLGAPNLHQVATTWPNAHVQQPQRAQASQRSARTGSSTGSSTDLRHRESAADLPNQHVRDLRVPRHRFDGSRRGVGPKGVRPPLSLQVTAVLPEVTEQIATLHPTTTFSRLADAGTPRRPSLRLSSRISAIALDKLFRAAALVRPWPFAPGISGQ